MASPGRRREELRLALGLRGGVSLAVWIGGACAELDAARRSSAGQPTDEREPFWDGLLDLAAVDVAVDIMAGASAGGLNGVIFAASQIYGFPMASLRDVWLDLGQLHAMVRRGGEAPSLLDGDGYFLAKLHEQLTELVARPESAAEAPKAAAVLRPRIDLFLTATLVEPIRRAGPRDAGESLDPHRYEAGFHFLELGRAAWLSDFGVAEADRARTLWQLAIAGRATSSFPGAFEAAAVWASRPACFADDAVGSATAERTDLRDVFTESRGEVDAGGTMADEHAFVVCDGGVLDNIPLGRAIRAITVAAADRPTRRVLVYVQPGAPARARASQSRSLAERRATLSVLGTVYRSKVTEETIAADLDLLERHNGEVVRARTLREQTLGAVDPASLVRAAERRYDEYRSQVAAAEARDVRRLLDDPVGALGKDMFPLTVAGADEAFRSPLAGCTRADRSLLDVALTRALGARTPPLDGPLDDPAARAHLLAGIAPLRRTTARLLSWAMFVEANASDDLEQRRAGLAKRTLYQTLLVIDLVLDRTRRFGWVALGTRSWARSGGGAPRTVDTLVAEAGAIADALAGISVTPDGVGARATEFLVARDLRLDDAGPLTALRTSILTALDRVVAGDPPTGDVDVRELLLDRVILPTLQDPPKVDSARAAASDDPARHLDRLISDTADRPTVVTLAALDVLDLPHALFGTPGDRPIEFERLSAAADTPVARAFTALWAKAAERHEGLAPPGPAPVDHPAGTPAWLAAAVLPAQPCVLPVEEKLAGNELANFSAFLRPAWRRNDWMWGRLDAVPTLVRLVATPQRLWLFGRAVHDDLARSGGEQPPEALAAAVTEQLLARLHELVVGPGGPPDPDLDPAVSWERFRELAIWQPARAGLEAEARALATAASEATLPPGLATNTMVAALAARRQWDLLAAELGTGGPKTTVERVNGYEVGAQRIREVFDDGDARLVRRLVATARSGVDVNLRATKAYRWVRPAYAPLDRATGLAVRAALGRRNRLAIGAGALAVVGGVAVSTVHGAHRDRGRLAALTVAGAGAWALHRLSRPIRDDGRS